MKNIFLYAKYLAHERKAKSIGINDLKKAAIDMSTFISSVYDLGILLSTELNVDIYQDFLENEEYETITKNIEIAKSISKINFSPTVKKILTTLNENGYSIKEETIKIELESNDDEFDSYLEDFLIDGDTIEENIEKLKTESIDDDFESYFGDSETIEKNTKKQEDEKIEFKSNDPLEIAINLKKELSSKIYGQDIAINAVIDSVKNKVVQSTNMPSHTFLFLGPPATGKTFMAKTIAESFEGYKFLELNMQHYTGEKDGLNIFGSESRYGNASPGDLTQFVRTHPKTVVLLDEFEKAHSNIQKKMLSIFSEGYLDDLNGWIKEENDFDADSKYVPYNSENSDHKERTDQIIRRVDFTQTIFVITSNLGQNLYNNYEFLDCLKKDYEKAETMIIQTLLNESKIEGNSSVPSIAPEMLSRISQGKIVLFNKLNFQNLIKISENIFDFKLQELLKQYSHLTVNKNNVFQPFLQCLLLKFAPYMDIRRIKSKIYERFSDKITDCLIDNEKTWSSIDTISINVSDNVLKFLFEKINPKIEDETLLKQLFRKNLTCELEYNLEYSDKSISLTITQASFVKVRKIEDMIGEGSISFDIPETSFDDIAGHEKVKDRLKEIANLLKSPEKLINYGAKVPIGMLLYGLSGTGKTMLAKAFANYADLPFIETTANNLIDHGSKNLDKMKQVFNRARDYSPSIIFIDEIDTFGSRQKNGSKAVINELLTQINGFSDNPDESIFIIAATNHKDEIDPAILRPGRVELHVEIPSLDARGREYFINKMLEKPCEKNINVSKLVMYSAGMTGAQLAKVSNESLLYAIRHGLDLITEELILEQINIEKYGNRITGKSIEEMLGETAYHEAGHAVISKILNPDTKIEQITVTPREDTLGFVSYDVEGSNSNPSKKDLENKICVAYAGRIAQMKQYGEDGLDTGASSDLKLATKLAYYMIAVVGMDDEIGDINIAGAYEIINHNNNLLDNTFLKSEVEQRVKGTLKDLKIKTQELVEKHWKKIDKLAQELLEKEVLHEDELNKLFIK